MTLKCNKISLMGGLLPKFTKMGGTLMGGLLPKFTKMTEYYFFQPIFSLFS